MAENRPPNEFQTYPSPSMNDPSLSPYNALMSAPMPWDPFMNAISPKPMTTMPITGGPVDSLQNPVEAGLAQIPKNWKEAALMGAMVAAPVVGQAAWKARGVPREVINSLKSSSGVIGSRDTLYHATNYRGIQGILESGEIKASKGSVSFFRDPTSTIKGNNPIILVVDRELTPRTKPYVNPGFGKTNELSYGESRDLDMVFTYYLTESEKKALMAKTEKLNSMINSGLASDPVKKRHMDGLYDGIEGIKSKGLNRLREESFTKPMNSRYESESRVVGSSVPLSSVKEVVINKDALIGSEADESKYINDVKSMAAGKGIPMRVIPNLRGLYTDRLSNYKTLKMIRVSDLKNDLLSKP
jgi:hypothetical protein